MPEPSDPIQSAASPPFRPLTAMRFAIAFLTRLPVAPAGDAAAAWRASFALHPAVGAAIGGCAALVWLAAAALALPPLVAAALALLATALLTGGLHEDGLADCGDGLLPAGRSPEQRLAAMRDSRSGAHGVLALVLVKLAQAGALASLSPAAGAMALIAAHGAARTLPPLLLAALPPARSAGLAATTGRLSWPVVGIAVIAGAVILALTALAAALYNGSAVGLWREALAHAGALALALAVVVVLVHRSARSLIGGVSGDVCGAAEQVGETVILVGFAAWLRA